MAVYPRACGGTRQPCHRRRGIRGLSPRVRGNHWAVPSATRFAGSIPARAGEPRAGAPPTPASPVYPRACGGTPRIRVGNGLCEGLSPRVRGNRHDARTRVMHIRSIPARAGEPPRSSRLTSGSPVYPRACGGTSWFTASTIRLSGLSPRVRGNRKRPHRSGGTWRSIPARAGEPGTAPPASRETPVYPRACGGTPLPTRISTLRVGLSPRVRGNRAGTGRV